MEGSLSILTPGGIRLVYLVASALAAAAPARALDCNENSVEDSADIATGSSRDCNSNQIPDECDILGHPLAFQESSRCRIRDAGSTSARMS